MRYYIDISNLVKKPGSGDSTDTGTGKPAKIADGVATFGPSEANTVATSGIYKIRVVELLSLGTDPSDDTVALYTKAATSGQFTIT